MAKFLLIYRDAAEPQSQPSPEKMQGFLAMWGDWFQQFGPKILDGGDHSHCSSQLDCPQTCKSLAVADVASINADPNCLQAAF